MFELRVQVEFCAAHHLEGYPGDCARPHGHNWMLEVFARSTKLDSIGMAVDFRKLKGAAKELVSAWDHRDLNQLEDFRTINPSAEQIAKLSYERLSAILNEGQTWIEKVTIWENSRCSASYFEEHKKGRGSSPVVE
ncbi:MAG: 6-pyruvoyl tetrahydropterin synthase family protein [Bdellovibrionales bacterium]|nr:6-pyruvoyl tetrahydropterin synthase family protein [Bdellovibrionales bacterium]